MARQRKIVRYVTDGTYSVAESRAALESQGVLLDLSSGDVKFVPDDPTFPTTLFKADGAIEMRLEPAGEMRLEEYVRQLSKWLGAALQPMGE
jgi:hypothetical protein